MHRITFSTVITNVIGIMAALLANYVQGWIDPVGAIILSTDLCLFTRL
jgi:ABC-type dipeptide/oligopeptide/nickel transport system permease subunit